MASHFKEKSNRKRKKFPLLETETLTVENQNEVIQASTVTEEVISIQTEPCGDLQVPVTQEDIQLQLPALVSQNIQNIQITTVDPSFLSKPIQIDPSLLQQLQQNININITLAPNINDQTNKLVDLNQSQSILNIETNPTAIPSTGTFTVNPMIIHQLGYTIPQQSETQITDSIPLTITDVNLAKNGSSEVFHNGEILDSQVLTLDNVGTEIILESTNKNCSEILSNTVTYQENEIFINENIELFTCSFCSRTFKTEGQLNAHESTHKMSTKYIYRCEVCNKNFKKRNHFMKHMLIHGN